MKKLLSIYNQNRHMFWLIVITVIAVIALIQVLNNYVYEKSKSNMDVKLKTNSTVTINNNYSVITGQDIKPDKKKFIDTFISYCNNKQIQEAYKMLTEECKQVLYPTIADFEQKYYSKIFAQKKKYSCQSWITADNAYTYRIDFVEDMLATGEPSKTSIIDYYTVVKDYNTNGYKLNINKFIGVKNINASKIYKKININVLRKQLYLDYEIYDIQVINNTQDKILLDTMKDSKNTYIEDSNSNKYFWYSHEILLNDITVKRGLNQTVSLKFNKQYKPSKEIVKIVFSDMILNNKPISLSVEI